MRQRNVRVPRPPGARRIAIAMTKGGVGKTTTVVNLGHGLSRMGHRVLLVDTDTQGQVAASLGLSGPGAPRTSLAEVLSEENPTAETVRAALVEARPGLFVLAGGRGLAGAARLISRKPYGEEQTLRRALEPLDDSFDVVLVDTGPTMDTLTTNTLFYCEDVMIPVELEPACLQNLEAFCSLIKGVQEFHPQLQIRWIVPTKFDRRPRQPRDLLEQLHQEHGDLVCRPIHRTVRLSEQVGHGETTYEYDPAVSGDYQGLTERVLRDLNLGDSLDHHQGKKIVWA